MNPGCLKDHISHPALENLGVLPEELEGGSWGGFGPGLPDQSRRGGGRKGI